MNSMKNPEGMRMPSTEEEGEEMEINPTEKPTEKTLEIELSDAEKKESEEPSEALKLELEKFQENAEAIIGDLQDTETIENLEEDKLQRYLDILHVATAALSGAGAGLLASVHGGEPIMAVGVGGLVAGLSGNLVSAMRTFLKKKERRE